jgi:MFS family permease
MSGLSLSLHLFASGGSMNDFIRIGALSDTIGRNRAVIFAAAWGLLGSSLQVAAQNAPWMLCARILAGVGTGGIAAVIPVWSSGGLDSIYLYHGCRITK